MACPLFHSVLTLTTEKVHKAMLPTPYLRIVQLTLPPVKAVNTVTVKKSEMAKVSTLTLTWKMK